jgi:hypothetical protein
MTRHVMDTSTQARNESRDDLNDSTGALSFVLKGVVPVFTVLTVVLIGFIWFKSGCHGSARGTSEDEDESLPTQAKYAGCS